MATLIGAPHDASLALEERIVAELDVLGVSYLSRGARAPGGEHATAREPSQLLADIVCQPSARVRSAVIALLLARPGYWRHVASAAAGLSPRDRSTLTLFYTAASILQAIHAAELRPHLGQAWQDLPDLFGEAFGLSEEGPPDRRLRELAALHARLSGSQLNWAGTYRDAAQRLLHQWRLETVWKT